MVKSPTPMTMCLPNHRTEKTTPSRKATRRLNCLAMHCN
jgi:hypothetical protein